MQNVTMILVLAMLCEALWETLKLIYKAGTGVDYNRLGAVVMGLLLAMVTGINIFELVNLPVHVPSVGIALTGLLLSRGANFVHDLLATVYSLKIKG